MLNGMTTILKEKGTLPSGRRAGVRAQTATSHGRCVICSLEKPYFIDDGTTYSTIDMVTAKLLEKMHPDEFVMRDLDAPMNMKLPNGSITRVLKWVLVPHMMIETLAAREVQLSNVRLNVIAGDTGEVIIGQREAISLGLTPLHVQLNNLYTRRSTTPILSWGGEAKRLNASKPAWIS